MIVIELTKRKLGFLMVECPSYIFAPSLWKYVLVAWWCAMGAARPAVIHSLLSLLPLHLPLSPGLRYDMDNENEVEKTKEKMKIIQ